MFDGFEEDELRLISAALAHEIGNTVRNTMQLRETVPQEYVKDLRKLKLLYNESLTEIARRGINKLAHQLVDDDGPYG